MFYYRVTMKKGMQKIRGFGHTLQAVQEWIQQQEKRGFMVVGTIESGLFERR